MTIANLPDEHEDTTAALAALRTAEEGFANQNKVTIFLQHLEQRRAARPQSQTNTHADIEDHIEACRDDWND